MTQYFDLLPGLRIRNESKQRTQELLRNLLVGYVLFLLSPSVAVAQSTDQATPQPFPPIAIEKIKSFEARYTNEKITIDGKLDEACWKNAKRSPKFVDLISGEPAVHDTELSILWDDENLYLAYWVEEPFVQGKLTERDSPIYEDNDVEFFVAGADAYYEFEINSLGTIYEGMFFWQDTFESKGYSRIPDFDQSRPDVKYQAFNGVGLTTHPRGKRFAYLKWDYPGAKSAVQVDGTLNDSSDRDRGWTVELAFPWKGMEVLARGDGRSLPPKPGDLWRMDFSRFNQYKAAPPAKDSGGWALSPHGVWDSHVPEVFPKITFVKE